MQPRRKRPLSPCRETAHGAAPAGLQPSKHADEASGPDSADSDQDVALRGTRRVSKRRRSGKQPCYKDYSTSSDGEDEASESDAAASESPDEEGEEDGTMARKGSRGSRRVPGRQQHRSRIRSRQQAHVPQQQGARLRGMRVEPNRLGCEGREGGKRAARAHGGGRKDGKGPRTLTMRPPAVRGAGCAGGGDVSDGAIVVGSDPEDGDHPHHRAAGRFTSVVYLLGESDGEEQQAAAPAAPLPQQPLQPAAGVAPPQRARSPPLAAQVEPHVISDDDADVGTDGPGPAAQLAAEPGAAVTGVVDGTQVGRPDGRQPMAAADAQAGGAQPEALPASPQLTPPRPLQQRAEQRQPTQPSVQQQEQQQQQPPRQSPPHSPPQQQQFQDAHAVPQAHAVPADMQPESNTTPWKTKAAKTLAKELREQKAANAALQAQVGELEAQVASKDQQLVQLQEQHAELEQLEWARGVLCERKLAADAAWLQQQEQRLRDEAAVKDLWLEEERAARAQLQDQLQAVQNEVRSLEAQLEQQQAVSEGLHVYVTQLQCDVVNATAEAAAREQEQQQQQAASTGLEQRLQYEAAQLSAQLQESSELRQRLQGAADEQEKRMADESTLRTQLQAEVQRLRGIAADQLKRLVNDREKWQLQARLQRLQTYHDQQLAAARHAVTTALEGQLAAEGKVQEVHAQFTAERLVRRQLQERVGELEEALRQSQRAGRAHAQAGHGADHQAPTATQHHPTRAVHASAQEHAAASALISVASAEAACNMPEEVPVVCEDSAAAQAVQAAATAAAMMQQQSQLQPRLRQ